MVLLCIKSTVSERTRNILSNQVLLVASVTINLSTSIKKIKKEVIKAPRTDEIKTRSALLLYNI